MPRRQHSATPLPSSGSHIPLATTSVVFPEPWRGDADVPVWAEHSMVTYSQNFDELGVSAITTAH